MAMSAINNSIPATEEPLIISISPIIEKALRMTKDRPECNPPGVGQKGTRIKKPRFERGFEGRLIRLVGDRSACAAWDAHILNQVLDMLRRRGG